MEGKQVGKWIIELVEQLERYWDDIFNSNMSIFMLKINNLNTSNEDNAYQTGLKVRCRIYL